MMKLQNRIETYTCTNNTAVRITQDRLAVKPVQAKMARAALGWSMERLAKAAGVHRNTIANFETEVYGADPETLQKMQRALEKAGIEFTNGDAPGVRLKKR